MNLKQLKLAGFKSFVDPTVVHFPSQLVAVVGPNGCGKSNIIDAVRWVMGESSARNLRGESMADVIFNGSAHRKPVGQASVELIFDNSLGRLAGPFASYGEIAVKRVVTRDGDSSYYLNGSRCRRKDITDIFLGTGAGARGYSIIGQGTISQLIEAKPEDLRVFLEEAAGVSKYKERRKETLQRIAHTRENMTRVADICDELEKQLQRLERQAKSAERYLILKEDEQLCRAEILALKWQDFVRQQAEKQGELQQLAVLHEAEQSRLVRANTERVTLNEQIHEVDECTQVIQARFYQLGTEIARLEETIQQQAREKKRLEQDQQQLREDWRLAEEKLKHDQDELLICQDNAHTLHERVHYSGMQFKELEAGWHDKQKQYAQWEPLWQEVQNQTNTLQRELHLVQLNIQHLEQKQQQTMLRLEKLRQEQESISLAELEDVKKNLDSEQCQLIKNQEVAAMQLQQCQEQEAQVRSQLQATEQQLHELHDAFYHGNSELGALTAAQKAARQGVHSTKNGIPQWHEKSRLMDVLQVDAKWQTACERVLHDDLHAYVLESFDDVWPQRTQCAQQGERVVTLRAEYAKHMHYPSLAEKIQGAIPAHAQLLEHIFTAETLDEALSWLPQIKDYQSIITPDGFWMGAGWVRFVAQNEEDEPGLLVRQQKIADLTVVVESLRQQIAEHKMQRDALHEQLQRCQNEVHAQQLHVNTSNDALRTSSTALSVHEQAITHALRQRALLAEECTELEMLLEDVAAEHIILKESLLRLEHQCQESALKQEQFLQEKHQWQETIAVHHRQLDEMRTRLHQDELEHDREKNKINQLVERIQREQERMDVVQERLEILAQQCLHAEEPGTELREQLNQQLLQHTDVELQLVTSREHLAQLRTTLEALEKNILHCDIEVRRVQEQIGQMRMQEQALAVRASAVQESLDESGLNAQSLLEHIPEGITQSMREDELIALSEKIKRLGAINLAAIDEFATEQQRKEYLDEQYADLSDALATLETAIEKMDKETRQRLEATFDEVNTSFKALFPRLFGGGRAQLELTCENLLEAGIVVMAQPPGKRNSTIHLLSGGEKAMTAVALVFAIFQLNPSPFCMLDEVDAPLDDVNVGRFCAMVKEMSQFVQFLFITHNKVTMELADHLMGVTMREPGVSRMVAVDVTQALAME